MKKFIILILAIVTLMAVAIPAMAADVVMYVNVTPNVNFVKGRPRAQP